MKWEGEHYKKKGVGGGYAAAVSCVKSKRVSSENARGAGLGVALFLIIMGRNRNAQTILYARRSHGELPCQHDESTLQRDYLTY